MNGELHVVSIRLQERYGVSGTEVVSGAGASAPAAEESSGVTIEKPYGVRMWNGRIYICDVRGSGGILVLDLRKRQARLMGATGTVSIKQPRDIAIGPEGTKYVVDISQEGILVYDADERYAGMFAMKDCKAVGIAGDPEAAARFLRSDETSGRRAARPAASPSVRRECRRRFRGTR